MIEVNRHLITGDKASSGILVAIRAFLKQIRLYRELAIECTAGGRDGDLGEEVMTYEVHVSGTGGGMTDGGVCLYSVLDDSTNGRAHMFSVLVSLPDEKAQKVLQFLEGLGFVGNRTSFKDRPTGSKSYQSYLDKAPALPLILNEFRYKPEEKTRAA